ncbi:hypothetical protein NSERUTF1_5363 [Nocardia seriolae]|nr:hypothetical protein NSERUTF1_5363 [Nocardia seriolae]
MDRRAPAARGPLSPLGACCVRSDSAESSTSPPGPYRGPAESFAARRASA